MAQALVSILIPAFNAARWIEATLRSALAQTWRRTEIIVVDDGSSDATPHIARRHASTSCKVVTQENRGAAAARNAALSLAQGDWIQYLDADDLLAPDKVAQQLRRAADDACCGSLLSAAWGRFLHTPKCARFQPDSLWTDLAPTEWIVRKFQHNVFMTPGAWLVSRTLSHRAGPWDERLSMDDDGEYAARLVAHSERVCFVPEATCYYRVGNPGSLSGRRSEQALESLLLSMSLGIEHLLGLERSAAHARVPQRCNTWTTTSSSSTPSTWSSQCVRRRWPRHWAAPCANPG
jgi:glycosyltransferase involved in cell wall biosynthesis